MTAASESDAPTGKIVTRIKRKVGILTLNRPDVLHALDLEALQQFCAILDDWAENTRVRAILIRTTGGRAFSAGFDLKWIRAEGKAAIEHVLGYGTKITSTIHLIPKPTLVEINGLATGLGMIMSMAADFRFVADSDKIFFELPEFGINLYPATGAAYFSVLNFGMAMAKEMLFTGKRYTIAEMQRKAPTFLTEVVPPDQLADRALKFAINLAKFSPGLMQVTKANMNMEGDRLTTAKLELEKDCARAMMRGFKASEVKQYVDDMYAKWGKLPE